MLIEAQVSNLLIHRLLAVRKILRFLVPATFDFHFRALEAELLGKPDRLTATMLEEFRRRHRYIV
jgi:hypothetical protein